MVRKLTALVISVLLLLTAAAGICAAEEKTITLAMVSAWDSVIPFDAELLVETEGCFEMPETYAGTGRLIESGADFTAVFTLSDTTGMAAIKALEDHGRHVPEDCSVIAIDGITVSEYVTPTLTTMVQPVEEMGRESVRILADMIEQRCTSRHLRLEARLRQGGSVRRI